jgi:hypothetical protein
MNQDPVSTADNPRHFSAFLPGLVAAREGLPLPIQSDFCIELGGDAGYAWSNLGGLSLEAAYQKFLECPEVNYEDFGWMFPRAFEYYYPVVDRYLRSANVADEFYHFDDGCQAGVLGFCLKSQFHWKDGSRPPDYVVSEIRELAQFVRHHLHHYSPDPSEQERIDACWEKLQGTLSALA